MREWRGTDGVYPAQFLNDATATIPANGHAGLEHWGPVNKAGEGDDDAAAAIVFSSSFSSIFCFNLD